MPHGGVRVTSGAGESQHEVALRVLSMRFIKRQRRDKPNARLAAHACGHGPGELMLLPASGEREPKLLPPPRRRIAGSAKRLPAIARFLPSLTDLAFLMPVIFIFFKLDGARTLLGDGDTGWHIRTGEWILAHHQVPHSRHVFVQPSRRAVVRLGMAVGRAFRACFISAGDWPPWFWRALIVICFTSVGAVPAVRRKCDNGLVAIAVTLLATGGCAIHWLARPHLFTLLFLRGHTAYYGARGRTGRTPGCWRGWFRSRWSGPICTAASSSSFWCSPAISVRTC